MIKTTRFTTETLNDILKILKADCIDFVSGSLLDNALYFFKATEYTTGWIAVYERFDTVNSYYYVEIADTEDDARGLYNRWRAFREKAEAAGDE